MKLFQALLPLLILLGVMTASVGYLSHRFSGFFHLPFKPLAFSLGGFLVFCFFGIMFAMRSHATGLWMHVMANVSSVGLGVLFFLLISTCLVDLTRLITAFSPSFYGFSALILASFLSGVALWNAQNTRVIQQEIALPHLSKPLRIMQFTDVHLGHYWGRKTLQKLVDLSLAEELDAVVITGDLFDGRTRLNRETIAPLKQLRVPIFFVQGNHDGYTGAQAIKDVLKECGVQVLSNRVAHLNDLQIVGLDYMVSDSESRDMMQVETFGRTIQQVLPTLGIDRNRPALLLHHNPIGEQYAQAAGIDLYLAGHTHSGQFYPIIWITRMIFKYNAGLYDYRGMKIYVSHGSGTFGPPMRLGTRSEITRITLVPKN